MAVRETEDFSSGDGGETHKTDLGTTLNEFKLDAIIKSHHRVENKIIQLRKDNHVQMQTLVSAVNQSALSLSMLAETAKRTRDLLTIIAETLTSIKDMMTEKMSLLPFSGSGIGKVSKSVVSTTIKNTEICDPPYFQVGHECFLSLDTWMPWSKARNFCQSNGSDLAQPSDLPALRDYLHNHNKSYDYWIGGTDKQREDTWEWLSGKPVPDAWMEGRPRLNADFNCLDFQSSKDPSLSDYDCKDSQRFICQKNITLLEEKRDDDQVNINIFPKVIQGLVSYITNSSNQYQNEKPINKTKTVGNEVINQLNTKDDNTSTTGKT
ncbi:unnamed protein product, partial [Meganyctiphanes norvegica]